MRAADRRGGLVALGLVVAALAGALAFLTFSDDSTVVSRESAAARTAPSASADPAGVGPQRDAAAAKPSGQAVPGPSGTRGPSGTSGPSGAGRASAAPQGASASSSRAATTAAGQTHRPASNSWLTVLDSLPQGQFSLEEAQRRAGTLGEGLVVVDSSSTPGLTPGFWAVVVPGLDSDDAAREMCAQYGRTPSGACYGRYVTG